MKTKKVKTKGQRKQEKKDKPIRERRWVKEWLGRLVYLNEDDSVVYVITAVDVLRHMVLCGTLWRNERSVTQVKSTSKKDWHRKPAYISNEPLAK